MDTLDAIEHGQVEELLLRNEDLSREVDELSVWLEAALSELKEREGRLSESEERFRLLSEKASVGIAYMGYLGSWFEFNDRLCEVLDYDREELLKMGFEQIVHPDDLDDADFWRLRQVLAGDIRAYSAETRFVRKDGSLVWGCLTVLSACDHEGDPEYFIVVVEDITGRKLKKLVPEPLTDREMEVLRLIVEGRTNRRIAKMLGYSEATIKLHVQRILAKLGVAKRTEAAKRAVEIGLVPPPSSEGKVAKRLRSISRFGPRNGHLADAPGVDGRIGS